eukprot:4063753-Alexandrium_andersonii.AAC.1
MALGAKWDPWAKLWYIARGTDPGKYASRKPTQSKTYLRVPVCDWAEAKTIGAQWDPYVWLWYVEPGLDLTGFSKWPVEEAPCRNAPELRTAQHRQSKPLKSKPPQSKPPQKEPPQSKFQQGEPSGSKSGLDPHAC